MKLYRPMLRIFVVIAATIISVAWVISKQTNSDATRAARPQIGDRVPVEQHAAAPTDVYRAPVATISGTSLAAEESRQTETKNPTFLTTDARKFAIENIRSGVPSDWAYARKIVNDCLGVRKLIDEQKASLASFRDFDEASVAKANQALQTLQLRCGQFTDDELSGLVKIPPPNDSVWSRLTMSADELRSENKTLASQLSTQPDPLLWDELASRVFLKRNAQGTYLEFRDIRLALSTNPEILGALQLVPCYLGLNCGASSTTLAMACIHGSACVNTREDLIYPELEAGTNSERAAAISLAKAIANQVKNYKGAPGMFAPPHGNR